MQGEVEKTSQLISKSNVLVLKLASLKFEYECDLGR